jgi:uncharacterized YccA/Bax inhibitor family protein
MRFRGQNPVYSRAEYGGYSEVSATYAGVTLKTAFLLTIIASIALYFGSSLDFETNITGMIITALVSPIVALIMVILAHRKVELAFVFSIIYAVFEGIFLGFISAIAASYAGSDAVLMALLATFGVLFGMLFLYGTGLIRVSAGFRRFLFSAIIGLLIASVFMIIMALTGLLDTHAGYSFYITIILFSVVISSLYLLVDFDNITNLVESGAGKEYEWSLSLGLVVTIVWLYIELLRLIVVISGRRK